jgi:hypothetical protein
LLDIFKYLKFINLYVEVLPFVFILIFYNRIINKDKRLFFIYTLITTIFIAIVSFLIFKTSNKSAYFLITRVYNIIEFSLLLFILNCSIQNKTIKKLLPYFILPFICICLYDYYTAKIPSIPLVPLLVESLFFICLILFFFFEKLKKEAVEPIFSSFSFWFAVAFLIFFAGNFFLFIYSKTSSNEINFNNNFTVIYSIVTIMKNIILCIATYSNDKSKNYSVTGHLNSDSFLFTPDKPNI